MICLHKTTSSYRRNSRYSKTIFYDADACNQEKRVLYDNSARLVVLTLYTSVLSTVGLKNAYLGIPSIVHVSV